MQLKFHVQLRTVDLNVNYEGRIEYFIIELQEVLADVCQVRFEGSLKMCALFGKVKCHLEAHVCLGSKFLECSHRRNLMARLS